MTPAIRATTTEPETWAIPADPGSHVRAVRDRGGNYWQRDYAQVPGEPDAWACPSPELIEQSRPVPFVARFPQLVFHRGPLVDATYERAGDRTEAAGPRLPAPGEGAQ